MIRRLFLVACDLLLVTRCLLLGVCGLRLRLRGFVWLCVLFVDRGLGSLFLRVVHCASCVVNHVVHVFVVCPLFASYRLLGVVCNVLFVVYCSLRVVCWLLFCCLSFVMDGLPFILVLLVVGSCCVSFAVRCALCVFRLWCSLCVVDCASVV